MANGNDKANDKAALKAAKAESSNPKPAQATSEPVHIWPIVNRPYTPGEKLVPNKEDRDDVKTLKRYIILDDPHVSKLQSAGLNCLLEGATIHMNRKFQPSAVKGKSDIAHGRVIALRNLKEFQVNALEPMPKEWHGKLRMLGESETVAADTSGVFVTLSSLRDSVSEVDKAEAKNSFLKELTAMSETLGIEFTEDQKQKLLLSARLSG